ncbi:MAG: heme b synthase [Euryarchaeota archaeon]|nr:heme b synthase [Euryarchaeota archaeon]
MEYLPRLIAWELTRACNLACIHCRASAITEPDPNELTTQEAKQLIDNIASFSKPILIMTGGEPLFRKDIFELTEYGTKKGLRVVLGTNATLITPEIAKKLKEAGIKRVTASLDGASPQSHDNFRKVPGAFESTLKGIEACRQAGISLQVNTTVTKQNIEEIEKILDLVIKLGVDAWHVFFLVPTGRGKLIEEKELPPEEYERALNWLYDVQKKVNMHVKVTCAPHYFRIMLQRAKAEGTTLKLQREGMHAMTKGCLAGTGFCFVSYVGDVYPCGYLPVKAGNVRDLTFKEIWLNSKLFTDLRDTSKLEGKCGYCEFKNICGGCRARAYSRYNDYLAEEPYCMYQPKKVSAKS